MKPGSPDDDDPGSPIEELKALQYEPSEEFFGRLVGSLERRHLIAQLMEVYVTGSQRATWNYLQAAFELFGVNTKTDQGEDDERDA